MRQDDSMTVKSIPRERKLELSCGGRRIYSDSIYVDFARGSKCDILADIHHLPFRDHSFEESVMFEVLEHLHSPYHALKEIGRVTDSILISIPNKFYYRHFLQWFFRGKFIVGEGHIYAWTIPEIRNLLANCGFVIKYVCFMTTHFHPKRKFSKLLPRIMDRALVIKAAKSDCTLAATGFMGIETTEKSKQG